MLTGDPGRADPTEGATRAYGLAGKALLFHLPFLNTLQRGKFPGISCGLLLDTGFNQ